MRCCGYSSAVRNGSGRVPLSSYDGKSVPQNPASAHLADRSGYISFVRPRYLSALFLVASCWTGAPGPVSAPVRDPAPAAARHPATAPPRPAFRSAEFGRWEPSGRFTPTLEIPLVPGTMFGWRIAVACSDEMIDVDEELVAPSAGDWGGSPDMIISPDLTTARVRASTVCGSEGIIDKHWSVSPNDPPGEWIVTVRISGYGKTVFRPTFTPP